MSIGMASEHVCCRSTWIAIYWMGAPNWGCFFNSTSRNDNVSVVTDIGNRASLWPIELTIKSSAMNLAHGSLATCNLFFKFILRNYPIVCMNIVDWNAIYMIKTRHLWDNMRFYKLEGLAAKNLISLILPICKVLYLPVKIFVYY